MAEPKTGIIFDKRYLILKELGSGGMGLVFHAKQVDADREVALKTLRLAVQDEESKARFFREFQVLSELKHPHIMTVYGLSLDSDSNPYAICEYLEGTSLRTYLANGALPWNETARIAIEIADALQFAHQNGIIHRDLKPENIMLVSKPHPNFVKVIDFGLSRVIQEGSQKLTGTGQLLGSPLYMSPEQTRQAADHRSDIYSLACIMFEMLSGQYLFPADDAVAAIYLHSNESATNRFVSISQIIPEKLLNLLADMLAKNPDERCQSAEEVSRRLKEVLLNPGKSVKQKPRSKNVRHKHTIITATLMIASVALTLLSIQKINPAVHKPTVFQATPKSLRGELIAIDREMHTLHSAQMESTIVQVPKDVIKKKTENFLLRLKPWESKAKNFREKYMVYWLESTCYRNLEDVENHLKYIQLCLELLRSREGTPYAEEASTLAMISTDLHTLQKNSEAKQYALEAVKLSDRLTKMAARGENIPTVTGDTLKNSPGWAGPQADMVLIQLYMEEKNFKEAEKYARAVHEGEIVRYPQGRAGNATITGTIYYANCLEKLNKKEQAIEAVSKIMDALNKPGDIPARPERPNEQRAVASDILRVYYTGCLWFKDNKLPKLCEKYAKRAIDYAKHYQLEEFWNDLAKDL